MPWTSLCGCPAYKTVTRLVEPGDVWKWNMLLALPCLTKLSCSVREWHECKHYRWTKALARDQLWTTPALWPQGLMQPVDFTQVNVRHCDCRWLFLWPLLGMQRCALNHSQKGIPQFRNSHTGLSDKVLTLLGYGDPTGQDILQPFP